MKKIKKIFLPICAISLCSCGANIETPPIEQPEEYPSLITDEDYLEVEGTKVKKSHGKGEEVLFKGINAGGYLVIEQWMCAFKGSKATGYLDHKTVTDIRTERFGQEKTLELWDYYRTNFWTDFDFEMCKEMGMNTIRLPFSYMNVDPEYNNVKKIIGQKYNFEILDDFVKRAASYGIYTILDLHGAYGSQNGQDHSGESQSREEVDFYTNEEKMSKTTDLWVAIAKHFKDNPCVAAFDLLNEPGEKAESTGEIHWKFFDRLNDAIRTIDEDRILIFESCWDGPNLPSPKKYGWENCIYSYHNYSGKFNSVEDNLGSYQSKLNSANKSNHGVPNYMGEFNCYAKKESRTTVLDLLNRNQWHYTSWTYKVNDLTDKYKGWGVFTSKAKPIVPDEDSFEEIKEKMYCVDTTYLDTEITEFSDQSTLKDVLTEYLK